MKQLLLFLIVSFACCSENNEWDSIFPPDKEIPLSEKKTKPMVSQKKSNTSSGSNNKKSGTTRQIVQVDKGGSKSAEGYQNQQKAIDKKAMEDYKDR